MTRCLCERCERERWQAFLARIPAAAAAPMEDGGGPSALCMLLIEDIHAERSDRHPLGIAETLSEAITALHIGYWDEAATLFKELIADEVGVIENDEASPCELNKEKENP